MNPPQLKKLRETPCVACGITPTDICHVRSVGAGGSMELWNLLSMCRRHHSEQHQISWSKFANKYPSVYRELKIRGWYFDEFNKLRNDSANLLR